MPEIVSTAMQAYGPQELLAWAGQAPDFVSGPISLQLERQRRDTVLASGGLPLDRGEPYYSMHLQPLKAEESFTHTVIPGLHGLADFMRVTQKLWNSAEYGQAPNYLVGVTHLRLADRKSTRLNSSHQIISYAVFCLKKKKKKIVRTHRTLSH